MRAEVTVRITGRARVRVGLRFRVKARVYG